MTARTLSREDRPPQYDPNTEYRNGSALGRGPKIFRRRRRAGVPGTKRFAFAAVKAGADVLVTSAPYLAKPRDLQVRIAAENGR